ncbi:periodic tryptophan protein 1 [Fistulifera solaris]|uniref:Periodic tryptophan protein 1 n=1 Tax=Fistulifera solaris TaxID=1519565 RepID=A0A1Z5JZS9_FISSO|nr:periodic tryptophan protein 1 [Fistulifera solaris]|eukprot:GAX19271.1 periodic tryptophan protein 1 [Fistulifera solaris]
MISSIAWVPRGVADPNPKRYEISSTERELLELMEKQGGDMAELESKLMAKLDKKERIVLPKAENTLPADLRMDEYSSDEEDVADLLMAGDDTDAGDEDEQEEGPADEGSKEDESGASVSDDEDDDLSDVPDTREFDALNVEGLEAMRFADSGMTGGMYATADDDENSDAEDIEIKEDDAILVVAKTEEDFATLEVHVYDQVTGTLFVHHDIPLPSYPLCLAHGQVATGGRTGNFCAVGTFSPGIEIWNLDIMNALEPTCMLGGEDTSAADDLLKLQMLKAAAGKQPEKRRKPLPSGLRPGSHEEAVMSLSWNTIHRQVLASGSADKTVKLWDVTRESGNINERCDSATFSHHRDKVQCVAWHPSEGTLLATGSFDRTVALLDARTNGENLKSVKLPSDCEAIAWDPFHSEYLTVLCEDGSMSCWDVRSFQSSSPLWTHVVNEYGGVTNLAYNHKVPGMMASCSRDATVSLWHAYPQNNAPAANISPRLVTTKDMCVGKLFALSFYPSTPWLLGCGGSGNQLALWDLSSEESLQAAFDPERSGGSPEESSPTNNQEDFEAMMKKETAAKVRTEQSTANSKKKKGKGKKKAHKAGH